MESVVRLVLTHRRVIAALLAGLAVWSAITAVTHSPATREVVVAARDLASGAPVTRSDVEIRRVPHAAVPAGTVATSAVTGRTLSGAMREGEIFTDRRVVDPRDLGADRVLAVVELSAATGELLRAGDAIDLVAVTEDGAGDTVAKALEVVTVRTDADRDAALVGVAASPPVATTVARAAMTARLAAVVVPRQRR